ncbi:histone deacetylase [Dehalogenimonas sp. 4OHTPN]|uniref:Histone deacetylase n=1 Tax=Dehalogenimonas sp. 4OHTPN TaxID=3166643 RepID=A0AAU8GB23_9CHLR
MTTGYVFHHSFLEHDTGAGHPETAARLEAVMSRLKSEGLLERLALIEARRAAEAELAAVHSRGYISRLKEICAAGGGWLDADTPVSKKSCEAAEYAAGGAVAAVEAVMGGGEGIPSCFALVRPPGHHAFAGEGGGFCLYNNIAIAARYAQSRYGLRRLAIIDFDVHFGNGTAAVFEDDPGVLFISTHQFPHYPGGGDIDDTGKGNRISIPLPEGCGDDEYLSMFDEVIIPAARRFEPELLLVSAGFDAHRDDPLAGMRVSTEGYAGIAGRLKRLADEACGGRAVFCLEGGYSLEALADSVSATFKALLGEAVDLSPRQVPPRVAGLVAELKRRHRLA